MTITRRLLATFLALVLALSPFIGFATDIHAAKVEAVKHTYDIAVVFDNSASMYAGSRWNEAKYAMEIFASMLDYNQGDKLTIFPMWEVMTVDNPKHSGAEPTKQGETDHLLSTNPISVRSKSDIDKIHKMFTDFGSTTPFTAVEDAYDYIKDSSATDRWLIVLTDGDFSDIESDEAEKKMLGYAKTGINVQFVALDPSKSFNLKKDEANNFYVEKTKQADLNNTIVGICNRIFQRNELPSKYFSAGSLEIPMSMNKVIVFVQGDGAKISSLKGASGEVAKISDSGQRKYSDIKYSMGYGYYGQYFGVGKEGEELIKVNDSLYGQVVIFDSCKAGTYTLDCPGADNVQIFYEPDVDIAFSLVNTKTDEVAFDNKTDFSQEIDIEEGQYQLDYYLIDAQTGEAIKNSDLLGKTDFIGTFTYSDGTKVECKTGKKIDLTSDTEVEFEIGGTYLDGQYKITTRDMIGIIKFDIKLKPVYILDVELGTEQEGKWYNINERDEWKPVKIDVSLNGQPLTEEQLADLDLSVSLTPDEIFAKGKPELKITTPERVPGESAYVVYVAKDDAGNESEISKDDLPLLDGVPYDVTATAKLHPSTDEPELVVEADDNMGIKFAKVSYEVYQVRNLIIAALILIPIAFLLAAFISAKRYPKKVIVRFTNGTDINVVFKKGVSRSVSCDDQIEVRATPECNLFTKSSSNATFTICSIDSPHISVKSFSLGGQTFEKSGADFVLIGTNESIDNGVSIKIRNGSPVSYTYSKRHQLVTETGNFVINH